MTCPDSDCHTKVNDTCRLVHSPADGLPSKVSKSTMTKWVIAVLGFMVTISIVLAMAWGNTKEQVVKNTTNYEHLVKSIEKMPTKGDIYRIVNKKLSADEKRKMMEE